MTAIGILGGMGPQASARLYEMLIIRSKQYTPDAMEIDYPEIVLLSVPVPKFISDISKLSEAKEILINRTRFLEKAGCVVNGIACNTAHILLPDLQAQTSVPFVSIPQLVASYIRINNYKRIGLLGTPTTLASNMFDESINGEVAIYKPSTNVAEEVETHIYNLLNGNLTANNRIEFTRLIDGFAQEHNLQAVILGCTELPLIYDGRAKVETIDTLQLLCEALLERYFTLKLGYNGVKHD